MEHNFSLAQIWREGAHEEEEGEKRRSSAQQIPERNSDAEVETHLYLVYHFDELAGLRAQASDMASISKPI